MFFQYTVEASEFYTVLVPYRTLAFFAYRFGRLASIVPYRFPFKTDKPRAEPFKTEFYIHSL